MTWFDLFTAAAQTKLHSVNKSGEPWYSWR